MAADNSSNSNSIQSALSSISTIVGIIAGVVGIVLTVYNLNSTHYKQKQETASAAPTFEVGYVSIQLELYKNITQRRAEATGKSSFFLTYPIMANEVADSKEVVTESLNVPDVQETEGEIRITCLMLQHKGKREAVDVQLNVNRVTLSKIEDMYEVPGSSTESFELKLKANVAATAKKQFTLGSIDTGEGIMIPLFVSRVSYDKKGQWSIISKIAYLPESVSFIDSATQERKEYPIRKMHDPIMLDNGIQVRG